MSTLALTPPGLVLDDIVIWGLVVLFAGLLVDFVVAAIVGRFLPGSGAGVAMVMFGLCGLGAAAWVAVYTYAESITVVLPTEGCETLPANSPEEPRSRDRFVLQRAGQPPVPLVSTPHKRACPQLPDPPTRLRVRRDELAARATPATAEVEEDARYPVAMMALFGGFAAFGLLAGTAVLANAAASRRARRGGAARAPAMVAPWRKSLADSLSSAGTLAAIGSWIAIAFIDDTVRAFQFGLYGPALACACYFVSFLLLRTLTVAKVATLLLIGGGFALAAVAVRFFA